MNEIVAANIRRLREEQKLSMDELAKRSGVSKSMLAQIERGDGNPTISTLWKLANGMRIPFDALTIRPKRNFEIINNRDILPLLEDNGKVQNRPLFPDDESRRFAIYLLNLEQGAYWESQPHLKGCEEFITVYAGRFTLCAAEKQFALQAGESIRFFADIPHSYRNVGDEAAVLHMVIYTP